MLDRLRELFSKPQVLWSLSDKFIVCLIIVAVVLVIAAILIMFLWISNAKAKRRRKKRKRIVRDAEDDK